MDEDWHDLARMLPDQLLEEEKLMCLAVATST